VKDVRESKRLERRSTILKAAASEFSREGYPNAKMQDIATRAGMGKGTIYQYFISKQQLFQQMIKEGIDVYIKSLELAAQNGKDVCDTLTKMAEFSLKFMQSNSHVLRIIASQHSALNKEMLEWIYDKKSEIIDMISEIFKGDNEMQNASVLFACCFFGMLISLASESAFHGRQFDISRVSKYIATICVYGLNLNTGYSHQQEGELVTNCS
jgi:AcrR family transcriptional regulator